VQWAARRSEFYADRMTADLGYGVLLSQVFSYREAARAKAWASLPRQPKLGSQPLDSARLRKLETHAAVDGEQLLAAIEYVEQLLPPIGADAWPERTGQLGAAVDAVRKLTCAHPVSIDQRHT
jgi:hypothetical protein